MKQPRVWAPKRLEKDRQTSMALFRKQRLREPVELYASLVNSVKRLNNDTAAKAAYWIQNLGAASVVPIAVISGVYSHDSLVRAQEVGLRLVWEHGMNELSDWLDRVRASARARRRPRKRRKT